MGLGDVTEQGHPQTGDRQCRRRPAQHHLALLHPRRCHASHAATGAIGVATAFALPGTVAQRMRRHAADLAGTPRHRRAAPAGPHRRAGRARSATVTRSLSRRRRWCAPPARSCRAISTCPTTSSPPLRPSSSTVQLRSGSRSTAFPDRPITIIVPTSAGGANDAIARAIARRLGPCLGQTVTVDNRSGAHGSIASEYVARAHPDGHTLLLGYVATHGMNPALRDPRLRPASPISHPSGSSATHPPCWSPQPATR